MKRTVYNKLVRDLIPGIIEASGREAVTAQIDSGDRLLHLREKLKEEMAEYLQSGSMEELADLLEVIHSLADCSGQTWDALEAMRLKKKRQRGGFDKGILLLEVIEP